MSIDRVKGKIAFTCDDCGDGYETGSSDFYEALDEAKSEGWAAVKDNDTGEWKHFCKDCK
jgi:hypothetical protein